MESIGSNSSKGPGLSGIPPAFGAFSRVPPKKSWTRPTVDGPNPAPPRKPWNHVFPVNSNEPWFESGAKWISSIHSRAGHLNFHPRFPRLCGSQQLVLRERLVDQHVRVCFLGSLMYPFKGWFNRVAGFPLKLHFLMVPPIETFATFGSKEGHGSDTLVAGTCHEKKNKLLFWGLPILAHIHLCSCQAGLRWLRR